MAKCLDMVSILVKTVLSIKVTSRATDSMGMEYRHGPTAASTMVSGKMVGNMVRDCIGSILMTNLRKASGTRVCVKSGFIGASHIRNNSLNKVNLWSKS